MAVEAVEAVVLVLKCERSLLPVLPENATWHGQVALKASIRKPQTLDHPRLNTLRPVELPRPGRDLCIFQTGLSCWGSSCFSAMLTLS